MSDYTAGEGLHHTHMFQGQKLVHSHPGGDQPHGYYGHPEDRPEPTYEVCADCHLFIEENDAAFDDDGNRLTVDIAQYVHLHRGDDADEALDETHEARPSGVRHTLAWWRENGPNAMKARFIVADREKAEDERFAAHPNHTECADGCGLDINHRGACLDKPGGRQVCDHTDDDDEEEPTVTACATCEDYVDDPRLRPTQAGDDDPLGLGWVHVLTGRAYCPGQEDDDTGDWAEPVQRRLSELPYYDGSI